MGDWTRHNRDLNDHQVTIVKVGRCTLREGNQSWPTLTDGIVGKWSAATADWLAACFSRKVLPPRGDFAWGRERKNRDKTPCE